MRSGRAWMLSLAALLLLLLAVGVQKVWSIDFWWQIRNGEWIIEHGKVPTSEMYSWSAAGNPLREMRWLYCAAVYLLFDRVGEWAPSFLQAALVSAAWLALAWPFRKNLRNPAVIALLALGLLAGIARWVMRPELATYLSFALFLTLLARLRETGGWRCILALFVTQVFWVNTHTLFLFGPILAWCFFAGDAVQRRVDRIRGGPPAPLVNTRLAITGVAVTAACWINPYFHDGAMYAVQMYRETRAGHATNQIIGEMRSPLAIPLADWTWDLFACVILAMVSTAIVARAWRRFDVVTCGILLLGLILFAQLQRNTPLFALCAVWAALRTLPTAPAAATTNDGIDLARLGHVATATACLLAAWYIACDRVGPRLNQPREFGLGIVRTIIPEGAARSARPDRPDGRLFNVVRDGAYLIWAARDVPVFIDGRTDAYGPELLTTAATMSPANWDEWSAANNIDVAIFPTLGFSPLVSHLDASPNWIVKYLDHRSVVFGRKHTTAVPMTTDNIPTDGPDLRIFDSFGPQSELGWKRWIGARPRAWKSEGLAQALLDLGETRSARMEMEAGLKVEPNNERLRVLLAPFYFAEGRVSGAAELLNGLSTDLRLSAFREAARLSMAAGKPREAEAALVECLELAPKDATSRDLRVALGDIRFQSGRAAEAAADYELAQTLAQSVNEWNKLATIYVGLKDFNRAERSLRASLALDPASPTQAPLWNMLGGLLAQRGDLGNARTCFEKALQANPNFTTARENLQRLSE